MCVSCGVNSCSGCGPWQLPQGPQGDPGPKGDTGEQGPTGPPGPSGANGLTIIHNDNTDSFNMGTPGYSILSPEKNFSYNPTNPNHLVVGKDALRIVAEFEQVTGAGVPVAAKDSIRIIFGDDSVFASCDDNTISSPYTTQIYAPGLNKLKAGCIIVEVEVNLLESNPGISEVLTKVFFGNTTLVGRKQLSIDFQAAFDIQIKDNGGLPPIFAPFPAGKIVCKHFKVERHKYAS